MTSSTQVHRPGILADAQAGLRNVEIARRYGVSETFVSRIARVARSQKPKHEFDDALRNELARAKASGKRIDAVFPYRYPSYAVEVVVDGIEVELIAPVDLILDGNPVYRPNKCVYDIVGGTRYALTWESYKAVVNFLESLGKAQYGAAA